MWKTKQYEIIIIQILISLIIGYLLIENMEINIYTFLITRKELKYSIIISIINYIIWKNIKSEEKEEGMERIKNIIIIINFFTSLFLIFSIDLLVLFLLIELYSITVYIIIYINKNNKIKSFGIIYFLLNSIVSMFILFSIWKIYQNYGLLNIKEIELIISKEYIINIIIISLLFKLGAVPLHFWVEQLYSSVNSYITLYIIIIPKIIYIFILSKFLFITDSYTLLFCASFLSLFIGAIYGLKHNILIKIIAFSSIFNIGFILLGLIANLELNKSIYEYIIIYSINTINILLILIFFNFKTFFDLSFSHKFGQFLFILSFISIIGLPPFAGFYAKYTIFLLLLNNINLSLFILLLFSLFTILISSCFYLKFIHYSFSITNTSTITYNSILANLPSSFTYTLIFTSLFLLLYPLFIPFFSSLLS